MSANEAGSGVAETTTMSSTKNVGDSDEIRCSSML